MKSTDNLNEFNLNTTPLYCLRLVVCAFLYYALYIKHCTMFCISQHRTSQYDYRPNDRPTHRPTGLPKANITPHIDRRSTAERLLIGHIPDAHLQGHQPNRALYWLTIRMRFGCCHMHSQIAHECKRNVHFRARQDARQRCGVFLCVVNVNVRASSTCVLETLVFDVWYYSSYNMDSGYANLRPTIHAIKPIYVLCLKKLWSDGRVLVFILTHLSTHNNVRFSNWLL